MPLKCPHVLVCQSLCMPSPGVRTCCGGVPAQASRSLGPNPFGQCAFHAPRHNVGSAGARPQVPLTFPLVKGDDACASPGFCECREGTRGALRAVCGQVGAAGDRRVSLPTPPTLPPPLWLGTEVEAEFPIPPSSGPGGPGPFLECLLLASHSARAAFQLLAPQHVPCRDRPHTTGLFLPSAHPRPVLRGCLFLTPDPWLRAVPHWCSWSPGHKARAQL